MINNIKIEFTKFTIVGLINFLFTLFIFFMLVEVLVINYLIALIAVSFLGMLLTYTLNYIWVFKLVEKINYRGRLLRYISAGCVSIFLNAMALKVLVDITANDPFWLQISLIPFVAGFNFLTAKYWALNGSQKIEIEHDLKI
jgi:putative flippase GtrA